MAKEPDQTKWVGIRPTDPSENIPVEWGVGAACTKVEPCAAGTVFKTSEQSPLTSIQVEPKLATTEFKTLTKKRAPAVADADAIESVVQFYDSQAYPAGGNITVVTGDVPAGKMWIITYAMSMHNDPTARPLEHYIEEDATAKAQINRDDALTAWLPLISQGRMILDEGQHFMFKVWGLAAGKAFRASCSGHQIDKY